MKLVFAHDHIFYRYKGEYFSNGGLSAQVLIRYRNIFGEVKVLSRQVSVDSVQGKLTKSSEDNVEFINIPNFKSLSKYYNILSAKKIIEKEVMFADLIIARLPSSIGSLAIDYAKKHNKAYAIEVVGCTWDALWNYGNIQGKIFAPFAYYNMKKQVRSSQYTLYVTNEFLQTKYPSNGSAIGCSNVDIANFSDEIIAKRINKINLDISKKNIKVGMIGSLGSEFKGFDIAIDAINLLAKKFTNIELFILGSGDNKKWTKVAEKKNVSNRVHFLGALESGTEVFKWLDSLDIYIQPSRTEGLPRATIEAMSRACPIVGSKAGGIPELIDDAFIHKNGDSIDLAKKLEILISNNEMLREQAVINFERSKQYSKNILDSRRNEFWSAIKDVIKIEK